jgi:hypothetical protein
LIRAKKLPLAKEVTMGLLSLPAGKRVLVANGLAMRRASIASIEMTCRRLGKTRQVEAPNEWMHEFSRGELPAIRIGLKKTKLRRAHWDALVQVGKVPAWEIVERAARVMCCDWCTLRDSASEAICRECPAVEMLKQMMDGAK